MASDKMISALDSLKNEVTASVKSLFSGKAPSKKGSGSTQTQAPTLSEYKNYQIQEPNILNSKEKAQSAYTEKDNENDLSRAGTRASNIRDSWANDNALKSRVDPTYQNPHAINNFRGNVNGRSSANTLYLSRLADAFNSQLHRTPTSIGARFGLDGGSSTGIENATPRRWDPIETQEMRQMRNNEQLDNYQRQQDINREAKVRGHSMDLQEQIDKAALDLSQYSSKADIDFGNMLKNAVANLDYTATGQTRLSQLQQAFATELKTHQDDKVAQMMLKNIDNPVFTNAMLQIYRLGAQAPDTAQWLAGRYANELVTALGMSGMSTADISSAVARYTGALQTAAAYGRLQGGISTFTNDALGNTLLK